ncbi:MAG: LuxR C-terminal-related transcriptional regulator [Actinomycetota bacterium]|nr:LuxR C-terminal-related transcriptional regulator [Actinomycetota bacterium]
MTSFIVHAKGFVLETTAELLRSQGVDVVEAPFAQDAASRMAESPNAVLVCSEVPPASTWRRRRVVLLDGVDDHDAAHLAACGACVTRPEAGGVRGFLRAAFAAKPVTDAAILQLPSERTSDRPILTRRQVEVVRLIARGHTSQEIADALGVRPKTVENYKQRLFARLGVQNQAHAVAKCAQLGLLGERPVASLAS